MKKIESGVFKIYFRGHKEHQGHIGQNLSGVFFSDTRVVVKNARFLFESCNNHAFKAQLC